MKLEQIIRKKRCLEYAVKVRHDKEAELLLAELLNEYYSNLDFCCHDLYVDYGYYKFHNNDIYKTAKEESEFRTLVCLECGKEINIIKTENNNWDTTIKDNKNLRILSPQVSISMGMNIQNLMENYYNLKQKYCGHIEFMNNGYYRILNQTIKQGNYNNSDFRIVTCKRCKQSIFLPKTEKLDWNSSIDNQAITVTKTKK